MGVTASATDKPKRKGAAAHLLGVGRRFGKGTDPSAASRKGWAKKRAAQAAEKEQHAALKNVALLEQKLRKNGSSADVKHLGMLMLDQMRRTAITAVELADLKARQQGHEHGLADLMANDLMRKPTETLAAWSKFLPMGGEAADSNAAQHLEAVRALSMATMAAGRAVEVMAGRADHGTAITLDINHSTVNDCEERKASPDGGDVGITANGGAPLSPRERASDDQTGVQSGCRVQNIADISDT